LSEDVYRKIREAFLEAYPYLSQPRLIETLLEQLSSKKSSLEEIYRELEQRVLEEKDIILSTDLKIVLSRLQSGLRFSH